jgi:aryl-alcohol dehydrogenase-like predicted oxidoreductase
MDYRKLGNSGAVVSAYCLGTMTFGHESDEATSFALMDDYVEAGGNFIDTADVYSAGVSEEIIGRWLKSKPGTAKNLVTASLKRLGVEQVDLYQMHAWDALTPLEETLRFLDDSIRNGKIAYYGFSNFLGWHLTKAVWQAKANGYTPPVTLQPQYSLLARDIEHELVPASLDAGIGLLPWSPLGGGWLSGKYKRDQLPTGATRLGENPKRGMEAFAARNAKPITWNVIGAVEDTAKALGASMAQVALAWVAAQPAVTSVILGARTREQLADNLGAAKLRLTDENIAELNTASKPEMSEYPYGTGGISQRHRKIEGGR